MKLSIMYQNKFEIVFKTSENVLIAMHILLVFYVLIIPITLSMHIDIYKVSDSALTLSIHIDTYEVSNGSPLLWYLTWSVFSTSSTELTTTRPRG